MKSVLSIVKKKLSRIFGDKGMDLTVLEKRVIEEPSLVVEELQNSEKLDIKVERLFARACVRAGKNKALILRLKGKQSHHSDPILLNFYVRALQAENDWEEIAQINSSLMVVNKNNALTLMKACLKTGRYDGISEVSQEFEFEGDDKVRAAFILFQALVKQQMHNEAMSIIPQFENTENENIFKWHQLTVKELKELRPADNDWVAFSLARLWFKKRQYISVISVLKPFIGKQFSSSLIKNYIFRYYGESLCNVLSRPALISELTVTVDAAKQHDDLNSFVSLYTGQLNHLNGHFREAVSYFNKSNESDYSLPSDKGAITVRSPEHIEKMLIAKKEKVIFDEANVIADCPMTTVVASDSKYFLLFFDIYQKSFKARNSGYQLHFHIVNPSEAVKVEIDKYRKTAGDINFSYSTAENSTNIKALYASIRFLIVGELLQYYNSPILITDIDVGFSGNLADLKFEEDSADIALKIRDESNLFPWRVIPANTTVFNNTEGAMQFIQYFSNYFYSIYGDGEGSNIWWIDQSALYSLYSYFKEKKGSVVFSNLYESYDIDSLLLFHQPFETKQEFINRVFNEK
ncbi:hypothetical protein Q4561_12560 [Alteromonas sp. 1_MG-2023]|uniref:hypothetical protein n=1 Tax=Alteromonas sp. 1_MG-2023 TaxID=3062669 RepID=UPI0026E24212|nr:hypothetical protein [Alteromonas sp. 1_MG-2023]MDO6567895.1 hypothetical protein [Alteromonas sp. 1_MG-2023]